MISPGGMFCKAIMPIESCFSGSMLVERLRYGKFAHTQIM